MSTTYRETTVEDEITGYQMRARIDVNDTGWNGFPNWEIEANDFRKWLETIEADHNDEETDESLQQWREALDNAESGHGGRERGDIFVPVGWGMICCFWETDEAQIRHKQETINRMLNDIACASWPAGPYYIDQLMSNGDAISIHAADSSELCILSQDDQQLARLFKAAPLMFETLAMVRRHCKDAMIWGAVVNLKDQMISLGDMVDAAIRAVRPEHLEEKA